MLAQAMPEVFVVSLERAADRRAAMTRHLDELGIEAEFITAIDGQQLSPEQRARCAAEDTLAVTGRALTEGEVGCALSHLEALRIVVDREIPRALILEDDACLAPGAVDVLRRSESFPKGWHIVLLGNFGVIGSLRPGRGAAASLWHRRRIHSEFELVRFVEIAWGAYAYLVSLEGARRILRAAQPVRAPIDRFTGIPSYANIELYGIAPCCVTTGAHDSLIGSTRDELRTRTQESLPARRLLGRELRDLPLLNVIHALDIPSKLETLRMRLRQLWPAGRI